jgi:hypothetical protein
MRATKICSDSKDQKQEEERIYEVLRSNGYPQEMLRKIHGEVRYGNLSSNNARTKKTR